MSTATGEEVMARLILEKPLKIKAKNVKALVLPSKNEMRNLQRRNDADRELLELDGLEEESTFRTCASRDVVAQMYNDMMNGNSVSITLTDEDDNVTESTVQFIGQFERMHYADLIEGSSIQDLDESTMAYVFNSDTLQFRFAPSEACAPVNRRGLVAVKGYEVSTA